MEPSTNTELCNVERRLKAHIEELSAKHSLEMKQLSDKCGRLQHAIRECSDLVRTLLQREASIVGNVYHPEPDDDEEYRQNRHSEQTVYESPGSRMETSRPRVVYRRDQRSQERHRY